jgi:2-dehydro-3-deoxyphosphogluconate aldolase / (4S)-4-hydroxy-2-oxoglutarate aldolase
MSSSSLPREAIAERLIAARVVPVLRLPSAELTERAVDCLLEAGFGAVEITLTTPGAVELIARLRTRCLVGAGTVLDLAAARRCLDAGAQFLVSPCVVDGLPTLAHAANAAALLAGFTPGEVLAARRAGADIVKLFPASSGGPAHLAAIHAVYPDIPLCPTGGVTAANMERYFKAGAALVGVGNAIVPLGELERGDLDAVTAHAAGYLKG